MEVLVCGGGAAGLMAAYYAAKNGNKVTVIEKNSRPGRKLMITGKGRCNVTNNCDKATLLQNCLQNPRFLYSAFENFSSADTINFFESQKVALKTERGNRVFPVSDKASDIVDALVNAAKKIGVKFINACIKEIDASEGAFCGVLLSDGTYLKADKCILATGGASYPATGSNGDGYEFAKKLGHTVTEITPSLIPLKIKENFCSKMMGLSLKNVRLDLYCEGVKKPVFSEQGEMLFTHFGISGPLALSASAHIFNANKKQHICVLDLKPALDISQLDARILRDFSKETNKIFRNSLNDLLPQKMIPTIVALSGIEPTLKVNQISRAQRLKLCETIKNLKMTVVGTRPIEEAIVTRGGINVKEIDPKTMQSKIVNGLYFAGEIIDVDAYTGGFNLQIAFSTGYLAGNNV